MNLDELERSLIRATQRELAPSAADRERHEAELFARLGGGSGGPTPLGSGSGSASWSTGPGGAGGALSRAALSPTAPLSQLSLSLRSSRLGMLGVGVIVGAMVGGWFGFGLGRSGWSAAREQAREPVTSAPSVALADVGGADALAANAGPGTTSSIESAGLESPSATGMPEGAPRLGPIPDAPLLPGESPASSPESGRGTGSNRARGPARHVPAPTESSLAAEVAMLQRARRALNAENGRLALGIVHDLDEQFPNGVLIEERSATRILSLCQLEQVDEARAAARVFLERYPASVYAERVRGSCGAAPEE